MARKRKRVPEVLWRLFRHRARSLADTILALIPPPPPLAADGCRCKGRRCLSCSGDEAMSFLVRPGDPSDYRNLLTGCFVVVSENAPPIPVFDPHCRWSQREIVRRTIEITMSEQTSSSNLICHSYQKVSRSSDVVDALTSSNWTLLLKRVGDALMVYLLKYSSIFLPLPRKKHHQIAGFPISELCTGVSRRMADSKYQNHPLAEIGTRKKRKRVNGAESTPGKQLCTHSLDSLPSSNSFKVDGNNGSSSVFNEEFSHEKWEGTSKQSTVSAKKRIRQYRWQRQRKRKHFAVCSTCSSTLCRGNCNLSRELQNGVPARSSQRDEPKISDCVCCPIFQNVPKMDKIAEIDRKHIFYKLERSTSMLPRKHILYTLRPNDSGASALFSNIFGVSGSNKNPGTIPCLHRSNSCPITSTCLYHSLNKLLKKLIRQTQNCRHMRLLDKHCSHKSSDQYSSRGTATVFEGIDSETNLFMSEQEGNAQVGKLIQVANAENCKKLSEETTVDAVEPSKCFCPKEKVISFIWAICRSIVPSSLLGETSNWRVLRKNISKFVQLRKFEKFSLKECIHKLKISKFPLLSNRYHGVMYNRCNELGIPDITRHAILERWIFWFFAHLVSPLVQANFYVTESELDKQEIMYYRKSTWEKLMRDAECMKGERYHLLSDASTRKILRKRLFGFSRARLRPKQIGFRMLTNLQAPSRMPVNSHPTIFSNQKVQRNAFSNHRVKYRFFKSVNSVLNDLHVVLKGLWTKEPAKLGSSVFNYNDVYRKLLSFLFLLKNGSSKMPSVYIVVSDVSKAFDSVNQDKLLSVMKDVILDEEYILEKFTQVIHMKKHLKVHQHLMLAHEDIATASPKITSRLHAQSLDSILVKKDFGRRIKKEEIYSILAEHIKRNLVHFDNNFYLQRVGIPQGSVLSSLLCSFYYGHMERNVLFPFLEKANKNLLGEYDNHGKEMFAYGSRYLLLRFIDDFLFVSTSKQQASMFFSRLERGVREYNCCMNVEKYGLNFNLNNRQGCQSNRLHVGRDGISFLRWSGLLVNCSTLEIQADYTRYLNSHLSSTLTVSCQGKVGRQLKARLHSYLRPKCHPIFYDSNINSPGVVRLNIYQVFLLCAMKFICYISKLSILPRFTEKFVTSAIYASLRYMNRLIKRKMYSFEADSAFRPKYDVKKKDIICLGLYAYIRVLKKKQSRYKKLLCLLKSKLKSYGTIKNLSAELRYAIDDAHSSVLWSIKY